MPDICDLKLLVGIAWLNSKPVAAYSFFVTLGILVILSIVLEGGLLGEVQCLLGSFVLYLLASFLLIDSGGTVKSLKILIFKSSITQAQYKVVFFINRYKKSPRLRAFYFVVRVGRKNYLGRVLPPVLNPETADFSRSLSLFIASAAAVVSSTSAAFCCVV